MITLAYFTARKEPMIAWFFNSLHRELGGDYSGISVQVVDYWAELPGRRESFAGQFKGPFDSLLHVTPKPCVWQGPHALTKEAWFAAGNARNTALCLCRTEWIIFLDDLSTMRPGFMQAATEATALPRNTISLGAYRKLKCMEVDREGLVRSHESYPAGVDNRQKHMDATLLEHKAFPAYGSWLYGCNLTAPVEAFLKINGWAEDLSGGISFEDCLTGVVMQNAGMKFRYDTRMMTFESEERHHVEPPFRKTDKGVSPNDKSHAALAAAQKLSRFDNGFDLRAMRQDVLAGKPFPIPTGPTKDWYDGQPLAEM